VSRITGTSGGVGAANDGVTVSDTGSSSMSFGNAIAPAPPTMASATVSPRIKISLMKLPLPADTTPRGVIGREPGN
jgi:hypothetical protein